MTSRWLSTLALSAAACALCTLGAGDAAAQVGGAILLPTENQDVSRVATRGAAFLSLGVGARPLALAGAYSATASDLSAMYWNVAGVGDVQQATAFASYEQLFGSSGLSNSFVGAAIPARSGSGRLEPSNAMLFTQTIRCWRTRCSAYLSATCTDRHGC